MKLSQITNLWLLPVSRAQRPLLRLFCIPCAGGWGQMFYPWARRVTPEVDLWAIQLPGRAMRVREPARTSLRELADEVACGILSQLTVPYAIFGHSMGALIAFEVARRLRARSWPMPTHLFLSGSGAPDLCHLRPPLHTLSDDEILEKLAGWKSMPPELSQHAEVLDVILPTLRNDFRLCDTYSYIEEAPLDVTMTVLGGTDDEEVPVESLDAWRRQTSARFSLATFPGSHFYFSSSEPQFFTVLNHEIRQVITREQHACQR